MLVITDRLGSLHLYTARLHSCVLISTSSLALAALSDARWDSVGCKEFIVTGSVFEDRSLFHKIAKLEPATVFRFEEGELRSQFRYWTLASVVYHHAPAERHVEQLAAALCESVSTSCRVYPNPVFDLTGGYDSRAVVAAARKIFTPHTVVNGRETDADVAASKRIARELGLPHLHQSLEPGWAQRQWTRAKAALLLSDGECDILEYARTLDAHLRLAERFDGSVNGSGGEVTKGYWWELLFPLIGSRHHFNERHVAEKRFVVELWIAAVTDLSDAPDMAEHFAGIIRRANASLEGYPNTAKMDNVYLTLRMQRWQGRIASSTNRIWPCWSPFLFRRPLEAALSAPPDVRVRHRLTRRLLEHLDPKLARIPLAGGYPALPLRLTNLHLFGPLAAEVCWKLANRLRLPGGGGRSPGRGASPNPLLKLWRLEEFGELLRPEGMVTRHFYRADQLAGLLAASRQPSFGAAGAVGRVLTLELLTRTLKPTPAGRTAEYVSSVSV
jgi:hypothetical protein